jgi:MFS transporter, CP family, cyanate transporter
MDMKKPVASLMVMALFIAALNLRPAINSISPLLQALQSDLGMSASVASLLTTIPVLCMGIFSPIAVKLGSRWGIERVLGWSLFLIGFGTILRLLTVSTLFLLLTAFTAGVGIAAMGPLLPGFIKRYFPNQVPAMISVYTVALTIGAALASGLSVPLESGLHSWKGSLSIWSILAFIAIPIWWIFVLRHRRRETSSNSPSQSSKLPLGNKKAWLLTISFGLMAMIFYSLTAWLPPIIQGMGYSKIYAGNALTFFAIIQIPVSLLLPFLLKRFPSRLLWLLISSVLEIVGFLMILLSIQPMGAAIIIGIGAGTLFPINLLLPIDETTNGEDAASWSGMAQAIGYVIGATGPIILGWIHDATGSFFFAVIGLMIIALLMILVQLVAVPRNRKINLKSEASIQEA